jgi:hypothetical protein
MPDPELLPETMKAVTAYNGVKWIHDYQEACVDKVIKFLPIIHTEKNGKYIEACFK